MLKHLSIENRVYYLYMKWINRLYIFFVGIVLSITTGFGIAAFYTQPIQPTFTNPYLDVTAPNCASNPQTQNTSECQVAMAKQDAVRAQADEKQHAYDASLKTYEQKNALYNRTAIFLGIVVGAIFALIGISMIKVSKLVANGLMFAGILTAILTRPLISLASLGAEIEMTSGGKASSYLEFGVLLVLSVVVIFVGLNTLKEQTT